jgi:hypothetical protein
VGQGHIHDFNPGIAPSGLFWTARIPVGSVDIDLGRVRASLRLTDFSTGDTIPGPAPVPATITLDMQWSGATADIEVRDLVHGFAGEYHECHATISWSAEESGFSFVSAPADTSVTRFAEIGRERNGRFFGEE